MDLDNPSYFNVAGDKQTDIRRNANSESSSECCQLTPPINKMGFRSFGRSISANSNDSSQFIRGEPRLSDLAPELAAQHISRQNSKTKVQNGIIYSSLAGDGDSADSGDEVFLEESTAKYYNVSVGNRRHSIGSFAARERSTSLSSSVKSFRDVASTSPKDDVDAPVDVPGLVATTHGVEMIDDHAIRHGSFPRKRCNKCVKGTVSRRTNMEDILIVSLKGSTAASLWVDYFFTYFQQMGTQINRKKFKIRHLAAEDFIEAKVDTNMFLESSSSVKLQLVVMCPELLQYITEHPDNTTFGKLFLPDRTLSLLLGVCDNDLTEIHRKVLPTYFKWQRMGVGQDQDENFTKDFIGHAMSILARVWKHQSSVAAQKKSCFSVSPKKIRQGQNSVFILLTYPLQKDDIIKISVEMDNEMIEVKEVKRRNPFTIKISVPDNFTKVTAVRNILVEKNGSIIGSRPIKCESRLSELEQILRQTNHPVEFMCQTLVLNPADRENLDNWLVHNFQRNLPPHFNLLANHTAPFMAAVQAHKHSHEEYPTLLHFAAKFGFEKLALQLLECAGADVACDIKNIHNMTPAEIAEEKDYTALAASLRDFLNMHEFSTIYAKFKAMAFHHSTSRSNLDENGYLVPRNHESSISRTNSLEQQYDVPKYQEQFYNIITSPPRPVTLKVTPPSQSTSHGMNGFLSPSDYTPMDLLNIKSIEDLETPEVKKAISPVNSLNHPRKHKKHQGHHGKESPPIITKTSSQKHLEVYEDREQNELLEILNDYKNNVHSIDQVEKLFEEWKHRHDVGKTSEEKQMMLTEMRERYRNLQQEKPGFFDKLKRWFVGHKQHTNNQVITQPTLTSSTSNLNVSNSQGQRPISGLSSSSSGSSERMSTISGSSVGDSGTHSDNEDRKMKIFGDDSFLKEQNKFIGSHMCSHYLAASKPIKCTSYNKTKLAPTIEETTSSHARNEGTEGQNDQYYIQYPPSGLPVPGLAGSYTKDDSFRKELEGHLMTRNQYMNIQVNTSFMHEPSTSNHDYMNCNKY